MKILLCKAPKEIPDDNDPYIVALQNAGIIAVSLDVLSFQYTNQEILREKVCHPEDFGGFIFTSPRGVTAVELSCRSTVFDKASWSAVPCYVVGEGTAKLVREKLDLTSKGQEAGSAQQLVQIICKEIVKNSIKPLLFPSADLKLNQVEESLSKAGIPVDVVTSYKTLPHPQLEDLLQQRLSNEEMYPDILVFFSPSGVSAVLPILSNLGYNCQSFRMVAIGPTTKASLEDHGQVVFATASQPSPSGLVEAIKAAQDHNALS